MNIYFYYRNIYLLKFIVANSNEFNSVSVWQMQCENKVLNSKIKVATKIIPLFEIKSELYVQKIREKGSESTILID